MNNTIETIYLLSSLIAVCAMVPQVKRLVLTKQSDELSLGTWATWGCCQLVSFMYALSLNVRAYIIVNATWIAFYALMVFLIIKYRTKRNLVMMVIDVLRRRKAAGSFW
jgi:uncharacterized protein with PQ loop repeat